MKIDSAVVCFSGGCDSLTLLYYVLRMEGLRQVHAVSFFYGQRHKKEIEYAREICSALEVPHFIYNVDLSVFGRSPLIDPNVSIPAHSEKNQPLTVVPFRNTLFLVFAAAHATIHGLEAVALGVVKDDLESYPDCRPEYFSAMQKALRLADRHHSLKIFTPFDELRKDEVVKLGVDLGVDYSKAWTCYKGEGKHCGICDACVERKRSFSLAGLKDPVEYDV